MKQATLYNRFHVIAQAIVERAHEGHLQPICERIVDHMTPDVDPFGWDELIRKATIAINRLPYGQVVTYMHRTARELRRTLPEQADISRREKQVVRRLVKEVLEACERDGLKSAKDLDFKVIDAYIEENTELKQTEK